MISISIADKKHFLLSLPLSLSLFPPGYVLSQMCVRPGSRCTWEGWPIPRCPCRRPCPVRRQVTASILWPAPRRAPSPAPCPRSLTAPTSAAWLALSTPSTIGWDGTENTFKFTSTSRVNRGVNIWLDRDLICFTIHLIICFKIVFAFFFGIIQVDMSL